MLGVQGEGSLGPSLPGVSKVSGEGRDKEAAGATFQLIKGADEMAEHTLEWAVDVLNKHGHDEGEDWRIEQGMTRRGPIRYVASWSTDCSLSEYEAIAVAERLEREAAGGPGERPGDDLAAAVDLIGRAIAGAEDGDCVPIKARRGEERIVTVGELRALLAAAGEGRGEG